MITNPLSTGSTLSSYLDSLLEKARAAKADSGGTDTDNTGSGVSSAGKARLQASTQAALAAAAGSFKATSAQHALEARQGTLGQDLRSALAKAGVALEGSVFFSLDDRGALAVKGSTKDQAAVQSFLASDASKPGFAARLSALAQDAEAHSGTVRQSAAISQAARMASGPGGVLSLYTSLMKQQDNTAAVFSLSAAHSSLSYPGMLASKA